MTPAGQVCSFLEYRMVNFKCQVDLAMGCPDIWSKIILCVSVRVLWMIFTLKLLE